VFRLTQILVSALVGLVLSAIVAALYVRWARMQMGAIDIALIAFTVGASILVWREAGNTPMLNDDPIPLVSPNDVLCPVVTYVSLGRLVGFRPVSNGPHWPRLRAPSTIAPSTIAPRNPCQTSRG
jgi:hypothetical protein